jgi:hypothetical protein
VATTFDELVAAALGEREPELRELIRRVVDAELDRLTRELVAEELELRRNGGTAARRDPDALADAPRSACVGSG